MWKCLNCSEDVPDNLSVCWNCESNNLGVVTGAPAAGKNTESEFKQFLTEKHRPKNCVGCNAKLKFAGTKAFREGTNWGMLGDFGEFFDRFNLQVGRVLSFDSLQIFVVYLSDL